MAQVITTKYYAIVKLFLSLFVLSLTVFEHLKLCVGQCGSAGSNQALCANLGIPCDFLSACQTPNRCILKSNATHTRNCITSCDLGIVNGNMVTLTNNETARPPTSPIKAGPIKKVT